MTFQKILCGSLQSLLDISDPGCDAPLVKVRPEIKRNLKLILISSQAKSEFSLILSPVLHQNDMSSSSM